MNFKMCMKRNPVFDTIMTFLQSDITSIQYMMVFIVSGEVRHSHRRFRIPQGVWYSGISASLFVILFKSPRLSHKLQLAGWLKRRTFLLWGSSNETTPRILGPVVWHQICHQYLKSEGLILRFSFFKKVKLRLFQPVYNKNYLPHLHDHQRVHELIFGTLTDHFSFTRYACLSTLTRPINK